MNALFLKDLADKTRRGLRGRVEAGKSGGGNAYGYDVVRSYDPNGEPVRGGRTINAAEAAVVREIFSRYAAGEAPRRIAFDLNARRIPAPRGGAWSASTLNGNRARGTGVLNNEMYIGRLVWNRLSYVKDPDTGKRRSRANADDAVVAVEAPELAIVPRELWDAVKARQAGLDERAAAKNEATGSTDPTASVLVEAAAALSVFRADALRRLRRRLLQDQRGAFRLLDRAQQGRDRLRQSPDDPPRRARGDGDGRAAQPAHGSGPVQGVRGRVHRGMESAAGGGRGKSQPCAQREGSRLPADRSAGRRSGRRRAGRTSDRKSSESSSDDASSSSASWRRPRRRRRGCIRTSRRSIAAKSRNCTARSGRRTAGPARELIRGLVEAIVLIPEEGRLRVEVRGELAAILRLSGCANEKAPAGGPELLAEQIKMVAGARNLRELTLNCPI